MPKQIHLNAFHMNSPGHSWAGLWAHPRDQSSAHNTPGYWTHLAKTAERGKLDAIFLADVIGVYDVYGGTPDAALKAAAQAPTLDPFPVVPLMAGVTEHIGFGVTATVSYEQPYLLARRFSTLDHLTGGRVAWNIVTGLLDSGARGAGQTGLAEHDSRYAAAEEFLDVTYKLWEGSWADDALVQDKAARLYTKPDRVRRVQHQGERYQLDALHLVHPSPQRTPFLFQAGSSTAGRDFAARHAEAVFVNGPTPELVAETVRDIRRRAVAHGRDAYDIKVFLGATLIVAPTDAEAQERHRSYAEYIDAEGTLALISGWSGIDLSRYGLDEKIQATESNAMRSLTDTLRRLGPEKAWTIRDLTRFGPEGTRGAFLIGSPATVADGLLHWVEATDVDGFNLVRLVMPESLEAIVDLLVPELQNRGVFKTDYADGPLRQKLSGSPRLSDRHPGARFRF
ncbi:N5,N10-methylene tetrahydromethanopterin reductase [Elstera litoralis]|uniref:N5,N10-methylene tetrahydromethanopterin reductase n=1 Tax=Elstera litoralis TaxID=552518 RepID=A0A0F3IUE7_9PROT|nr:LLM class flavin-dependent oxidoreductase [Elstera litoralis]KJV10331.1 N5,N10-methylene tetrahydromethanopterin reductase [Elstera litoralis]